MCWREAFEIARSPLAVVLSDGLPAEELKES